MNRVVSAGFATLCTWTLSIACSSSDDPDGGPSATGGSIASGGATGGQQTQASGGLPLASGGASSGGTSSGGASTGGSSTGGVDTGGAGGGSETGGAGSGGETSETLPNGLPLLLSETGLYEDDMTTLGPGVRYFEPRFPLWTDGAAKRRWIRIPEGEQIDSTDMNYWEYPVGTTLWKEFVRDEVRVETRIIQKMSGRRWAMVAYLWRDDLSDADAIVEGMEDASGTEHDVPSEEQCWECHNRMPDAPLGFIAVQLAHEGSDATAGELEWTLSKLGEEEMLTTSPPASLELPGNEVEQKALSYLQGNCAHCHHPETTLSRVADMSFQLDVNALGTVEETPAYTTTVGVAANLEEVGSVAEFRVDASGDLENSMVMERYLENGTKTAMPPLGTEIVDPAGKEAIEAWISSLDD